MDFLHNIIKWKQQFDIDYFYECPNFRYSDTSINTKGYMSFGIPSDIKILSTIEEITLDSKGFDYIQKELSKLQYLKRLHLLHTDIKSLPDEILTMPSLKTITFFNNSKLVLSNNNLKNLQKLEVYGLSQEVERLVAPQWIVKLWDWAIKHNIQGKNTWDGVKDGIPMDRATLLKMDKLMIRGSQIEELPIEIANLDGFK